MFITTKRIIYKKGKNGKNNGMDDIRWELYQKTFFGEYSSEIETKFDQFIIKFGIIYNEL